MLVCLKSWTIYCCLQSCCNGPDIQRLGRSYQCFFRSICQEPVDKITTKWMDVLAYMHRNVAWVWSNTNLWRASYIKSRLLFIPYKPHTHMTWVRRTTKVRGPYWSLLIREEYWSPDSALDWPGLSESLYAVSCCPPHLNNSVFTDGRMR